MVILIATIEFISTNRSKLIAIFIVLAAIYYSIFVLFRKIERKIVKHFYDYKYNFVRCLQESIDGAEMFNICEFKTEVIARAEQKYLVLAQYKLSASYTTYGLSLICDFLSITLLAIGIEYGI
jgi:ABC-type bacteriocin/lantibiotic exporter with double-glycine peptidase domain